VRLRVKLGLKQKGEKMKWTFQQKVTEVTKGVAVPDLKANIPFANGA